MLYQILLPSFVISRSDVGQQNIFTRSALSRKSFSVSSLTEFRRSSRSKEGGSFFEDTKMKTRDKKSETPDELGAWVALKKTD